MNMGINFVSDMLNENGSVLSLNEMKQVYHSNINFLNYYAISGLVKKNSFPKIKKETNWIY